MLLTRQEKVKCCSVELNFVVKQLEDPLTSETGGCLGAGRGGGGGGGGGYSGGGLHRHRRRIRQLGEVDNDQGELDLDHSHPPVSDPEHVDPEVIKRTVYFGIYFVSRRDY